jgi:hypothetical protein
VGLDMYLYARKYVSRFDYNNGERIERGDFAALNETAPKGLTKYGEFTGIQIDYPILYWRKANAIHGWFVNECAGGVDECQPIYVSRESLVKLRDLANQAAYQAAYQPAMAESILPPTAGFFFGTYEIDEWYIQDMNYTVKALNHVLSTIPEDDWNWSFIYQASW